MARKALTGPKTLALRFIPFPARQQISLWVRLGCHPMRWQPTFYTAMKLIIIVTLFLALAIGAATVALAIDLPQPECFPCDHA